MSASKSLSPLALTSDAELVAASLRGDRESFGRIVERYQRLLCSLAYSATGQLSESEDLAQEAFVEAWRQLSKLREPEKLRPWLCGILRRKVGRLRRSDGREPVRQAVALEEASELAGADQPTETRAMREEEQAILWSELERVPELYREPLVLYYREHRSVEHVAAALDLSEDAVKQRLSRGRKLLQERVMAFVEGALTRSTPGRVFTLGVLAALPALSTPAKAAALGAAAAHGGALAKTTGLAAAMASSTGLVTTVIQLRTCLDQSRGPRERRFTIKATLAVFCSAMGFLALLYGCRSAALQWPQYRFALAWFSQAAIVFGTIAWIVSIQRVMRAGRRLRSEERRDHPELFSNPRDRIGSSESEYTSRWSFLGLPLVRVRFSTPDENDKPIFAWVAGGDRACGLLFAWGGFTIAPISVGAVSIGLLSVGSVSFGIISLGTLGIGVVALGAVSIGVKSFGWLSALGWESAQSGGFAVARVAAEGPIGIARFANNEQARQLLADPNAERTMMIFYMLIVVLALTPICYYAREVRRRLGKRAGSSEAE